MSEAGTSKCSVCGFLVGEEGACDRCGTILTAKKIVCQSCGNPLPAFSFVCEYCGKSITEAKQEGELSEKKIEAMKRFQLIPGVTENMASRLYDEGVTDFASLVALSLTERQKEKGLHHILARRIMLMDLLGTKKKKVASEVVECPTCKSIVDASTQKCPVCGYCTMIGLDEKVKKFEEKLGECIEEAYTKISKDKGFREMPVPMQKEISKMLREKEDSRSVTRECEDQLHSWQEKGFDLNELEEMLRTDFGSRKNAKPAKSSKEPSEPKKEAVICPLCQSEVDGGSSSCGNCGAKFKKG